MDLGDVNTPDAWASLRGGDMRFRAIIQLSGKTSTGISVPSAVVEGLGSGKRPPVRVTINGHSYRSTVAPMGGEFLLPVSAENPERAGVEPGDEEELTMEPDTEPRPLPLPHASTDP